MYQKLEQIRKTIACIDDEDLKVDLNRQVSESQDFLLRKTNITVIRPVYDDCRQLTLW